MNESILLVEDNAHDIELTMLALERCALRDRVTVVRDGEEAWNICSRRVSMQTACPAIPR